VHDGLISTDQADVLRRDLAAHAEAATAVHVLHEGEFWVAAD
jgi:hypothetical protein